MKTNYPLNKSPRGFSLIELMTVVAIMAVLGAVASPALVSAVRNAHQQKAATHARQIAIGLRNSAMDNDGAFPVGENFYGEEITSSNDAFRALIPHYIDTERVFEVRRSAWGPKADNKFAELGDILQAGENHFAYIAGLSDTSISDWPLVVDGTNGDGKYTNMKGSKGGAWEGTKGIVVTVGGSARVLKYKGFGEDLFLPREGYPDENALDVKSYMGENVELLDPIEPSN